MAEMPSAANISWERMIRAVEIVKERLHRATRALTAADIPNAVAGGNAVAFWVATIDDEAVRNTPDVDIVVRREDFERALTAMACEGFECAAVNGIASFIDTLEGAKRPAVHLVFAREKVRPDDLEPSVPVTESQPSDKGYRVLTLEALVRMKLISYRLKDQVHLQDLLRVGLFDATWTSRFRPELAARLQIILDDPEG